MRSSVALNQVVILFIYLYTSSGTLEKVEYGPSQIWNGSLHVLIVEYVIHTTALWPDWATLQCYIENLPLKQRHPWQCTSFFFHFLLLLLLSKMSCPSSIRHRDSTPPPFVHESFPITTIPGLPPLTHKFLYRLKILLNVEYKSIIRWQMFIICNESINQAKAVEAISSVVEKRKKSMSFFASTRFFVQQNLLLMFSRSVTRWWKK